MPSTPTQLQRPPVWHSAVAFTVSIYSATREFPREERFALAVQLRRAATSIAANLTEGEARYGVRQLRAFAEIAYGSARECEVLLLIAERTGALRAHRAVALQAELAVVSKQLLGLLRSLRSR